MLNYSVNPPLSNIQMELLKLYAAGINDEDLNDLKIIIAKFLLDKARKKADLLWEKRRYTQDTINELLDGKD